MSKYRCDACGEAEQANLEPCLFESEIWTPENCPISGDECEWYQLPKEKPNG